MTLTKKEVELLVADAVNKVPKEERMRLLDVVKGFAFGVSAAHDKESEKKATNAQL